mgnify:CR=1 FL=1
MPKGLPPDGGSPFKRLTARNILPAVALASAATVSTTATAAAESATAATTGAGVLHVGRDDLDAAGLPITASEALLRRAASAPKTVVAEFERLVNRK